MKKYFPILKNYGIITFGVFITAFSLTLFLAPNRLTSGGVSGMATVLYFVTGIPIGVLSILLNIPIFLVGIGKEGKAFGFKSIYATVALSLLIDVFSSLPPLTDDIFLAAVFGGLSMGAGLGLVLASSATTGGTDIIAKLVKRRLRHLTIGRLLLGIDILVITFAAAVFRDAAIGMYSAVALIVCTLTIDFIIDGGKFAKTVFIISDNYKSIAEAVNSDLNRGVTGIFGKGMYSGGEKLILMCILRRNEIPRLKDLVKSIDSEAFVILADVREVLGEGFVEQIN